MEDEVQDEGVNESHPNKGEIEEAVEDVDLGDSPENVTDGDSGPDEESS